MNQPVREIAREIWAVVARTVAENATRDIDARVFFVCELNVRIRFVVAQQYVEAWFVLLDEIVFERERFLIVVDLNEIDIARFRDQASGLDFGEPVLIEIASYTAAKVLGFANVKNLSLCVFIEVNARPGRKLRYFFT